MRARAVSVLAPLAIVVALLAAWEAAAQWDVLADALGIEPFLVPAPSEIADSLWADRSLLADNAWVTLKEVVLGLAIAIALGFAFAVALHVSDALRRFREIRNFFRSRWKANQVKRHPADKRSRIRSRRRRESGFFQFREDKSVDLRLAP